MIPWDELLQTKKIQLARQLCAGNHTAENMNRAIEALSNNPNLVAKTAREAGIADEIETPKESSVEDKVERSIKPRIATPEKGERSSDYMRRLQESIDRGMSNEVYEHPVYGPSRVSEGEL